MSRLDDLITVAQAQKIADTRFFGVHWARREGLIQGKKINGRWFYSESSVRKLTDSYPEPKPLTVEEWRCGHYHLYGYWWTLDRVPQCVNSKREGSRYCGVHRRDDNDDTQKRCNDHFLKIAIRNSEAEAESTA